MTSSLAIDTTVRLHSGYELHLPGLGVYNNDDAKPACVAALKAGYRHIDSARMYRNETQVGEAVRESGTPRNRVYITSKIGNNEHDHDNTLAAVDVAQGTFQQLQPSNQQKEIVEYCKTHGIFIEACAPLMRAHWNVPEILEVAKKVFSPSIDSYSTNSLKPRTRTAQQVSWASPRPMVAAAWSLDQVRIVNNADVCDFELTAEDVAAIDALDRGKDGAVNWNPIDVD